MVLEHLFHTHTLLESKLKLFLYSAIVAIISLSVSYIFFSDYASMMSIAFITIAFTHVIHSIYRRVEKQETIKTLNFFKKYNFVFVVYAKMFIALALVFSIIFVIVPANIRNVLFLDQINTLKNISHVKESIAANFFVSNPFFPLIIFNNLKVLFAVLFLSFLYGAGAVFLISYQASILGTLIGTKVLDLANKYLGFGAAAKLLAFAHASYLSLAILPHGILEIFAYFIAAVAGGIISAALVGHYRNNKISVIATDVLLLIITSVILLIIAAIIESYLLIL